MLNKVSERLEFCIKHDLITYLDFHNSSRSPNEVVITADIFDEHRRIRIESLTSLSDLASLIGDKFESCSRKLSGRQTKVVAGPKEFLMREIEDEE